ncbi:ATP-binding protein [Chitinivorax sp. B]|uniref:ATP-binding protein n=1 Tax=Chitinivorax sp. B TaxID=2502235 RepID=UPI0010F54CFC|nr:ATP-binding protein [Chitinivorax sp. B]
MITQLMAWLKRAIAYPQAHPLGWRLLCLILLVSTVFALLSTAIQLLSDYRRDMSQIETRLEYMVRANREILASAAWNFDRGQLQSVLKGFLESPDIRYASFVDTIGRKMAEAGTPVVADMLERTEPVSFMTDQQTIHVGQIRIVATKEDVYSRVISRVLVITVTQVFKTFCVAILILLIFRQLVSRHLTALAQYASKLDLQSLNTSVTLPEKRRNQPPDELDILVDAINHMLATLAGDVRKLDQARADLAESEDRYRSLVESTNVVPWEADADSWHLRFVGSQAVNLLGVPLHDWLQPDFLKQRMVKSDWDALQMRCQQSTDGRFDHECRLLRDDDTEIWVALHAVRRQQDGRRLLQGYLINISLRKAQELELAAYRTGLEQLVHTRTSDLRQRNVELQEINAKLEAAHSQLYQAEKMASIGQLAAGVAHEINNPIGYVHSNLCTLENYVVGLLRMIQAYEASEKALAQDIRDMLTNYKNETDLAFVKDDLPVLLEQSRAGLGRVKQIVADLKDFSRVGMEDEWTLVNLADCLDSTANVLGPELREVADVVRHYQPIPLVECQPSQINQVLLNLLVNAMQSIDGRGTITLSCGAAANEVWLEVADNGSGMSAEVQSKIFDPFFTTRPIGEGSGLGLSVAYGIVSKHGGRFEVHSVVGEGSRFRLWLPLHRSEMPREATLDMAEFIDRHDG